MVLTTSKYIIRIIGISNKVVNISINNKDGHLILDEEMPSKSLYDIMYGIFYLIEESISIDLKFPINNTQYAYILYGGKTNNFSGSYHLILIRQNLTNDDDFVIADEFLEYYQLKNIINEINNFN